jgi:hypothetical protein
MRSSSRRFLVKVILSVAVLAFSLASASPKDAAPTASEVKACLEKIRANPPLDASLSEGQSVTLVGRSTCATGYSWSVSGNPSVTVTDSSTRSLHFILPRVSKEANFKARLTSRIGDSAVVQEINIRILDNVPDPVFSLPFGLQWDGRDTFEIEPVISNLKAIVESPFQELHYSWSLDSIEADTSWVGSSLELKPMANDGTLGIGLCIDNGGAKVCGKTTIAVWHGMASSSSSAVLAKLRNNAAPFRSANLYDVTGRLLRAETPGHRAAQRPVPGFLR